MPVAVQSMVLVEEVRVIEVDLLEVGVVLGAATLRVEEVLVETLGL